MAPKKKKTETRRDIAKEGFAELKEQARLAKEMPKFLAKILGLKSDINVIDKEILHKNRQGIKMSKAKAKRTLKTIKANRQIAQSMISQNATLGKLVGMQKQLNLVAKANPYMAILALVIAIGAALYSAHKAVVATRKEFGVTYATSAKLAAQQQFLKYQMIDINATSEDIKEAQLAIIDVFGDATKVTNKFVKQLVTAESTLGKGLLPGIVKMSLMMEATSDLTQKQLITNLVNFGKILQKDGMSTAVILKDVADQTEFFAQYAKDGGQNILDAAVHARKLGLNLGTAANVSNNLLNFESSIEKQMEASMLLGRQVNLDRARQLALAGKHKEMLVEIKKQAGGEAEFTKLNVIQRKALAESVGVSVEELSRLVRNQVQTEGLNMKGEAQKAHKTELEALKAISENTYPLNAKAPEGESFWGKLGGIFSGAK